MLSQILFFFSLVSVSLVHAYTTETFGITNADIANIYVLTDSDSELIRSVELIISDIEANRLSGDQCYEQLLTLKTAHLRSLCIRLVNQLSAVNSASASSLDATYYTSIISAFLSQFELFLFQESTNLAIDLETLLKFAFEAHCIHQAICFDDQENFSFYSCSDMGISSMMISSIFSNSKQTFDQIYTLCKSEIDPNDPSSAVAIQDAIDSLNTAKEYLNQNGDPASLFLKNFFDALALGLTSLNNARETGSHPFNAMNWSAYQSMILLASSHLSKINSMGH